MLKLIIIFLWSSCLTLPLQETKYFLAKVFQYRTTFLLFLPIGRISCHQSIVYKYSHRKTSSELVLVFPYSSRILRNWAVNVWTIISCQLLFNPDYVCKILYGAVRFWKLTFLSLIVVLWIVPLTVSFLVIHTIAMDTLNLRIIIWNTPKLQSIVNTNRDDPIKDGLFISTTSIKRFRVCNSVKNVFGLYDSNYC